MRALGNSMCSDPIWIHVGIWVRWRQTTATTATNMLLVSIYVTTCRNTHVYISHGNSFTHQHQMADDGHFNYFIYLTQHINGEFLTSAKKVWQKTPLGHQKMSFVKIELCQIGKYCVKTEVLAHSSSKQHQNLQKSKKYGRGHKEQYPHVQVGADQALWILPTGGPDHRFHWEGPPLGSHHRGNPQEQKHSQSRISICR